MNSAGFIVYGASYYELDPPYVCQFNQLQTDRDTEPINIVTQTELMGKPFQSALAGEFGLQNNAVTFDYACSQEEMCTSETTEMVGYYIQTNNATYPYIRNWITQCNLECTPKSYIGLSGGYAFLGAALACFFLP